MRKNPHYPRRKQLLTPIIESTKSTLLTSCVTPTTTDHTHCYNLSEKCQQCLTPKETNTTEVTTRYISPYTTESDRICKMCRNSFRSCEFCNINVSRKLSTRLPRTSGMLVGTTTYNPVYNIREIRSVCHSFSSMGLEKKLLDTDRSTKALSLNGSLIGNATTTNSSAIVQEVVNNNPAKGYGSYVYI